MLKTVVILNDHGFVSGGAAQVALAGISLLAEKGLNVIFLFGNGPCNFEFDENMVNVIDLKKFELISNPSRIDAAFSGVWDRDTSQSVNDVLSRLNPNETIVHLHTWTKSLSASVINEVIKCGFKLVCTLHDYFAVCPNGGLFNYTLQQPCQIQPMSLNCIITNCDSRSYTHKLWRVSRQFIQTQYGGMPNKVKYFITVSSFSEDIFKKYLPEDAQVFRVPNPIGIDRGKPANPAAAKGFVFVGRITPEKGADLFAEAALIANVTAFFVGDGSSVSHVHFINPQAQFLGWKDKNGVIKALQNSRAVIFPSRWYETQGLIIKEAAALGVPAIVSDGCAGADSVIDGKTGLLFRAGDFLDLAKKLRFLEDNPKIAVSLGQAAYTNYWKNPETTAHHVNKLMNCYHSIMDL